MRLKQIDNVCYMKWKSAKRRYELVLPFGWIMRWKRKLRKDDD